MKGLHIGYLATVFLDCGATRPRRGLPLRDGNRSRERFLPSLSLSSPLLDIGALRDDA